MITFLVMYALFGVIAGILAGLLGVGGGLVLVPLFVIAFEIQGLPPNLIMHMALGTSLTSIIFTSFSSAYSHHRRGGVEWKIIKYICLGIVIGTYVGSYVASYIPAQYLQILFSMFLFYVTSQMILSKTPKASRHMPGFFMTNVAGVCIGFVSSLVGVGGGTLSVPYMLWHNVGIRHAIGTSAAIGMPIAIAGGVGYYINGLGTPNLPEYSAGFIYLPALFGVVLCSMLTAPLGARVAYILPVSKIKKFFAFFLSIVGIRMLWTAIF